MRGLLIGLALLCAAGPAVAAKRPLYKVGTATCGGFPRAPVDMAKGYCMGLVLSPASDVFRAREVKMPRTLLPLDATGTRWLIADLGAWSADKGAIWRMTVVPGGKPRLEKLLPASMPHTLAFGPDGRVYVGEMSRIVAFDPNAASPAATAQAVVTGLPDNRLHEDRHPLSAFIFDADGSLLVDVGAPSDQCLDAKGQPQILAGGAPRCAQSEGAEPTAAIRRYPYLGSGKWGGYTVLARGLRNSVAMARHGSGTLLQAENSYDFPTADEPYESVNVVLAGHHYGWPYCFDINQPTPGWKGRGAMDCASAARTRPAALMAPHAAPLSMLYYQGAMFPELRGKLVMSWHGYRASGSRIVAFDVDARGVPVARTGAKYPVDVAGKTAWKPYRAGPGAQPLTITTGWRAKPGVRPTGAPVGLAAAGDGALWVADDRNGTIMRIARDRP